MEEARVTLKVDVISLNGVLKAGLHLISGGYVQVLGACKVSNEIPRLMKGREFHDWLCYYDCVLKDCVLCSWLTCVAISPQKNFKKHLSSVTKYFPVFTKLLLQGRM